VAQAKANLSVARLPAREQEITAASEQVKRAEAALASAEWRLSKRQISAAADGTISDVLRQPGDNAGPQAAVFDLLPDGATKIRLYFPQDQFSQLQPGTKLAINCDGCDADIPAEVIYISSEPEFTPPVIYSIENRQKLVFLVEARETGDTPRLRPGQIVDGRIADAGE
jgi:HlyD family secretion protein